MDSSPAKTALPTSSPSPLQAELDALKRATRVYRSAVAIAALPRDLLLSGITMLLCGALLWPNIVHGNEPGLGMVALTGLLMLWLLQLMKVLFVYPAIRGRQVALVQQLRRVIFREGILMNFLFEEDRGSAGQTAAAGPLESARQLVLPQQRSSVPRRFYEYAIEKLRSHIEFSHLRQPVGQMELRAALALAVAEEFAGERPGRAAPP